MLFNKIKAIPKEQWVKIGKGAGLAGGAAVITYLIDAVPSMSLGDWAPAVVALLSVLLNIIRKSSVK